MATALTPGHNLRDNCTTVVSRPALKKWEHPKRSGIRIHEVHPKGNARSSFMVFVPRIYTGTLRKRKQFSTVADAEKFAKETKDGHDQLGRDHFTVTDKERREHLALLHLAKGHGVSLTDLVTYAIKHVRPGGQAKTLRAIIEEQMELKEKRFRDGGLRARSYEDLKQRGEKIASAFEGRMASEVTATDITAWIDGMKVGARSARNYLYMLGSIFKYATQEGYIGSSPLDRLSDDKRKALYGGEIEAVPSILTPEQAENLLRAARSHPELDMLGAVTLACFCGIRTEEIKRVPWSDVHLDREEPFIRISAANAKKKSVRDVLIPPNALKWLALIEHKGQVTRSVDRNDFQRRFAKLLVAAKIESWEVNSMRHSFGSYHFAKYGDSMKTSALMGHRQGDSVLFANYRALATKEQGDKYFNIEPV